MIETILDNLNRKIRRSAIKSGRNPEDIRLVAVSKTVPLDRVIKAINAGVRILGENRVQEAKEKILSLRSQSFDLPVEWHMIGHLQKNKARNAVQLFDMIHSLDSVELAVILDKHSKQIGKTQRVLVQVKLSDEESKHGTCEAEAYDLLEKVFALKNLRLEGLMTIPPYSEDPEQSRPYYRKLREIRDSAAKKGMYLKELSMGMSNDFEVAIEEGSTMVRIGTAIFGQRIY